MPRRRREGPPIRSGSTAIKLLRWSVVVAIGSGLAILAAYLGSAPRFSGLLSHEPRGGSAGDSSPPNVILISLDTVRPDHLGAYGYGRALTPSFDGLAAKGVLFRRSVAASSWTIPSHAAVLTGVPPSHIGPGLVSRGRRGTVHLPPEAVTLAEVFRTARYHTAAFIGGATMGSVFGFDQGFDLFNDRLPPSLSTGADRIFLARPIRRLLNIDPPSFLRFLDPPFILVSNFLYDESHSLPSDLHVSFMKGVKRFDNSASEVNHKVFSWLDHRPPRPFFAFIHYFDAHDPYDPPPPFAPAGYDPAPSFIMKNGVAERVLNGRGPLTSSERDHLVAGYDGEIASLDHHLGVLLDRLRAEGVLDNAVIAVVSDHGESFGEHGLVFHGHHLYDHLTRSVLLLSGRGVPQGRTEDGPAAGIDVAPTLLDLAGLDRPGSVQGRSLRPLLEGKTIDQAPLFSELLGRTMSAPDWEAFRHTRFSVEFSGLKIIRESDGPTRLFDLAADPDESTDLAAVRTADVERLSRLLADYLSRVAAPRPEEEGEAAEEALESLRGLGYIH
jgi:arylsulfatase A-like enzyme